MFLLMLDVTALLGIGIIQSEPTKDGQSCRVIQRWKFPLPWLPARLPSARFVDVLHTGSRSCIGGDEVWPELPAPK